jgi:hypothetical protein
MLGVKRLWKRVKGGWCEMCVRPEVWEWGWGGEPCANKPPGSMLDGWGMATAGEGLGGSQRSEEEWGWEVVGRRGLIACEGGGSVENELPGLDFGWGGHWEQL